jgi:molybdenum cofactor guanylyltransferase
MREGRELIEAVLLTGGASRRMGQDKAKIVVEGEPLAARIARLIAPEVARVTVLGREPVEGYVFLPDEEAYLGPLVALARFRPSAPLVFVSSCDLPRFDARVIPLLRERMGEDDAALVSWQDRPQPLCALYRASCWAILDELAQRGERRMMAWLDRLRWTLVDERALEAAGLPPELARNVNRPEDFS